MRLRRVAFVGTTLTLLGYLTLYLLLDLSFPLEANKVSLKKLFIFCITNLI